MADSRCFNIAPSSLDTIPYCFRDSLFSTQIWPTFVNTVKTGDAKADADRYRAIRALASSGKGYYRATQRRSECCIMQIL